MEYNTIILGRPGSGRAYYPVYERAGEGNEPMLFSEFLEKEKNEKLKDGVAEKSNEIEL